MKIQVEIECDNLKHYISDTSIQNALEDYYGDMAFTVREMPDRENARLRAIIQRVIKYATPWKTTIPTQEILTMLREANAEAHGRAVARTVQPLVGSLDSE